jgi:hypothetical protein
VRGGGRKKEKYKLPPFVPVLNDEMDSKAYRDLPGSAAKALVYFKRIDGKLFRKYRDDYNGIFDFTYSEAKRLGFARSTFSKVIGELHDKGFIDIISVGGLRGAGRSNSKYKLIEKWRLYGQDFKPKPRRPTEP